MFRATGKNVRAGVCLLVFLAAAQGVALAQQLPGTLRGEVQDVYDNPLIGATVRANAAGYTLSATTDSQGRYQMSLPPNTYSVTATVTGYSPLTQSATVYSSQTTTLNFTFGTCTYSISPSGANVGPAAGTGSFAMTAPALCAWTASTKDTWITVTSGSGTGNGTIRYQYSSNVSTSSRAGSINATGGTYTLTQSGDTVAPSITIASPTTSSTYTTTSSSLSIGGTASDNLAVSAVTWSNDRGGKGTAAGTTSWSVSGIALQSGVNVLTATATDPLGHSSSDSLAVNYCTFSISPNSRLHGPGSETGRVSVNCPSGCSWNASANQSWLSITSGSTGSGSGSVSYAVAPNTGTSSRSGSLTVAGQTFTVVQEGFVAPLITSLRPQQVVAGDPAFSLLVSGSNFSAKAIVRWNGQDRTTTFLGVSQLKAAISASDVAVQGPAEVTVADPDRGTSASRSLTILPPESPIPTLRRISPMAALQGGAGFKLVVNGFGFVPGSRVLWNGQNRGTTYESSTLLSAVIPATDIAAVGEATITISNPAPGGGTSAGVSFKVLSGTVITDLSPVTVVPGGRSFRLSVFGQNFLAAGVAAGTAIGGPRNAGDTPVVTWNGQPLATVAVSSTELRAEVPSNLVGSEGTSATVAVSGGGSGSSNMIPVPVTVTKPAPSLSVLSPKGTAAGAARFTLAVEGRNFVEGAKVLWDGAERETQFVDSTKLQAVIPEADVAAAGASLVSVANPEPGGGLSNAQVFNHIETLLYPRLVTASRPAGSEADVSEYTGIAFTNLGLRELAVTFTAFDKDGAPIAGTGITNPALVPVAAGEQRAVLDWQVFGDGLPARKPEGWFRMETSGSGLAGFFLMLNETGSILDGADVSAQTATTYIVPEIEEGGFTQLHVVNPDINGSELLFEVYGSDGNLKGPAVSRTLGANGAVVEKVAEMFSGITVQGTDYIRVVSNRGIGLFEYFGRSGIYVEGLNGQDAAGGGITLYSPQYVVGGGDWRTALTVINLEERPGTVSLRLLGDNGALLGGPVVRAIPARGKLAITDQDFFVTPGSSATQGYVEVKSDGPRLTGSVVFGDPERNLFASALPLVSEMRTEMVFSQLASNDTYYTGLALLNPGSSEAAVQIEVRDETGSLIAAKEERIGAGRRVSKLLTQYFPQMVGQQHNLGYIRVTSDRGIASFALFGTQNRSALSAVPAQKMP